MAKDEAMDKLFPVYLSVTTLMSAIQSLREHGLPPKIDRSAFSSRSGVDQRQIMGAFKFLGLIDKENNTQPILKKLHDCPQGRPEEKRIYEEILKSSYTRVFDSIDLKTATPAQLNEAIGLYGPTGSTKDRAVRFFIKAAEYAGILLSGHLTRGTREREAAPAIPVNGNATTSPRKRRKRIASTGQSGPKEPTRSESESAMRTISLPVAKGTLTLSGSFNPFQLIGEERDLVYQIIDKMNEYEQKAKTEKTDE